MTVVIVAVGIFAMAHGCMPPAAQGSTITAETLLPAALQGTAAVTDVYTSVGGLFKEDHVNWAQGT